MREDKQGERRAPLSPQHVQELVRDHGVAVRVEPSPERVFPDAEYATAGAELSEQLEACDLLWRHIASVGERIRRERLPPNLRPVVVAFAGSGNVSKGAQEVFERLPYQELDDHELAGRGS